MQLSALILDDDASSREGLAAIAQSLGYAVSSVGSLNEAEEQLKSNDFHVLLLDLELPDGKGTDLLTSVSEEKDTEIVFITGYASVESAVAALRGGAVDYLTKPVEVRHLKKILKNIKRTQALRSRISELSHELRALGRFGDMVGASKPMQKVYDLLEQVAPTNATVLITGETGSGKEVVAQTLHKLSRRVDGPFVPINCGAVPPSLMESELFGHEKGSFTGADKLRKGMFERAHTGTLFLDEVTEMPLELQVKLLRVLETRKVQRVGGDQLIDVDVRIVAATNRNPHEAVEKEKLREDLLYRLSVFPVPLPPLRERGGDIELLADHFLNRLNREAETSKKFHRSTLASMRAYSWPGNVRELLNTVERAYIMGGDVIGPDCLPWADQQSAPSAPSPGRDNGEPTSPPAVPSGAPVALADLEREHILRTLETLGGDKRAAAKALGVSLKTLYNRLKKYQEED